MTRTNENYLRWKFGQWVAKGYTPNVTILKPGQEHHASLESGESAVAYIELEGDPTPILLTDLRILHGTETLVRYDEVKSCIWIDKDDALAAKLKSTKFHRIIFDLHHEREVVLDGLGQAVFPLLNFFCFNLGRNRSRCVVE